MSLYPHLPVARLHNQFFLSFSERYPQIGDLAFGLVLLGSASWLQPRDFRRRETLAAKSFRRSGRFSNTER